jgi:hypothetical protein
MKVRAVAMSVGISVKSEFQLSLNTLLLYFNHHQGITKFTKLLNAYTPAYNNSINYLHKLSSHIVNTNILIFTEIF